MGLSLKTSKDQSYICYFVVFSGRFCKRMEYWDGLIVLFYNSNILLFIRRFKKIHEKNNTNDVTAYTIVVFFTVYSADMSKLIIVNPRNL